MEIIPKIDLYPSRNDIIIRDMIISGMSEIKGAKATFNPYLNSCFMVEHNKQKHWSW